MTQYNFVKMHSGLTSNSAIERLCSKIKLYMIKNKLQIVTPRMVKEVQTTPLCELMNMEDKRI